MQQELHDGQPPIERQLAQRSGLRARGAGQNFFERKLRGIAPEQLIKRGEAGSRLLRVQILLHLRKRAGIAQRLVGKQKRRKLLPAAGRGELPCRSARAAEEKVLRVQPQIAQHGRMHAAGGGIGLPGGKTRLELDAAHAVERRHVEASGRLVIARRVARGHDEPALRQAVYAKGLVLQHLQNRWHERLGHAVDLVEEQDPLAQAGLLHLLVDGGDDLAHGVFRGAEGLPCRRAAHNDGQAERALARVVRHGVGGEADVLLLRQLGKDRGLADTRRAHEKDWPLHPPRHAVHAVFGLGRVGPDGPPQLLLRLCYIHRSSPFGASASRISFSAHAGRSISSYRYRSITKTARYAGGTSGKTP